jgi:hypothetical protein
MRITAGMISCRQREEVRAQTLAGLEQSDWGEAPVLVMDESDHPVTWRRIEETFLRLLRTLLATEADFFLLLEDDLETSPRLRHNLERWPTLVRAARGERPFFGSLYRCGQPIIWHDVRRRTLVAAPESFWGAQALVVSRATASHALARWELGQRPHDTQLPALAAQLGPVYYHHPSLVQHRAVDSTCGTKAHRSPDYDPRFCSP